MSKKKRKISFYQIFNQKFGNIDIMLLIAPLLLLLIGLTALFSAAKGDATVWLLPQLIKFVLFLPVVFILAVINIKYIIRLAYVFFGLCVILLIIAEFKGYLAMGAQRWIRIGPISLQPSEPAKLAVILVLARYFHYIHYHNVNKFFYMLAPAGLALIPFVLIAAQPDLGTSLVIIGISGTLFFATGIKSWKFILVGVMIMVAVPFAWKFALHDYQKKRVETFLNPEKDPLGSGYNIIQSKIAIGSGGFFGKGLLNGTQSQLNFLPEKQTDFIFTMISEELGFFGAIAVISLYALLIFKINMVALKCKHHFGRLVAVGIAMNFFIHFFVNIAMVMGLLPVVGIPLPFVSYGGTVMVSSLVSIGIVLNIAINSDENISRTDILNRYS